MVLRRSFESGVLVLFVASNFWTNGNSLAFFRSKVLCLGGTSDRGGVLECTVDGTRLLPTKTVMFGLYSWISGILAVIGYNGELFLAKRHTQSYATPY